MWPKSSPPHPTPRLARGDRQGTGVPPAFPETRFDPLPPAWVEERIGEQSASNAPPRFAGEHISAGHLEMVVSKGAPRQTTQRVHLVSTLRRGGGSYGGLMG